jgi:DAK2 domain fusion protein YloV
MKKLNYKQFSKMFESGVNKLIKNSEKINDLNVFPVPDGDTGTNMGMTFSSGLLETEDVNREIISVYIAKFSRGSLMGARGNSGVISSQIFKGFSDALEGVVGELSMEEFGKVFVAAKKASYAAVQEPVEGTILTVVRKLSENKRITTPKFNDFIEYFEAIVKETKIIVDDTPNLLAVLKEAGVVDSGAYGLLMFFEGALASLKGKSIPKLEETTVIGVERISKADPRKNIGYCTEFIMTLKNPNTAIYSVIKNYLETMGDSIVIVQDYDILKIHIHTKKPGKVMNDLHKYGEFSKIKSDNMTTQVAENHLFQGDFKEDNIVVITVANGNGIIAEFNEAGAKTVIEGGQSMNPSTADFVDVINQLPAKNVFILPNNSNIIMSAEQAAKTFEKDKKKTITILPSKTIPEGLAALYNFSPEGTVKDNIEAMTNAIEST